MPFQMGSSQHQQCLSDISDVQFLFFQIGFYHPLEWVISIFVYKLLALVVSRLILLLCLLPFTCFDQELGKKQAPPAVFDAIPLFYSMVKSPVECSVDSIYVRL